MEKNNKEHIDPVEKKALEDAIRNFHANRGKDLPEFDNIKTQNTAPVQVAPVLEKAQPVTMSGFQSADDFQKISEKQFQTAYVDPDLTVGYEIVSLPSKGIYYANRKSEVTVEYMTSKDEDILSTSSLIENGTVLDILLKNKIKDTGINTDELLVGDRNAILLFLRASSYGEEYEVKVTDPRNGNTFPSKVNLTKLKAKEIKHLPDDRGEFSLKVPVRKKLVKFKILNYKEINHVLKTAEAKQDAYSTSYNEFGSLKLKAEIVEVEGNRNKDYIVSFVDALPARDSAELKKRIQEVTPDVDMSYEFTTADGFKFNAKISVGVDFFFPFI
jgi:hypothetical protein